MIENAVNVAKRSSTNWKEWSFREERTEKRQYALIVVMS